MFKIFFQSFRIFDSIIIISIIIGSIFTANARDQTENEWRRDIIRVRQRLAEIPQEIQIIPSDLMIIKDGNQRNIAIAERRTLLGAEKQGLLVRERELEKQLRVIEKREAEEGRLRTIAIRKAEAELESMKKQRESPSASTAAPTKNKNYNVNVSWQCQIAAATVVAVVCIFKILHSYFTQ